ncbi:MAG: NADH-quinone oxidoreductase subunit N [Bacteriovoracales bacterium]|nr:NADH-quinone oxidoreductase subunit N [Bacteriovoracales bacterium]
MTTTLIANLSRYVPELIAVVTMIGALFLEAAVGKFDKAKDYIFSAAGIGLILCLISLSKNMSLSATPIFTGAVIIDPFSTMVKIIMVLGVLGSLYVAFVSKDIAENHKSEFVILAMGVLVGGMLLASANNFLTVYLGIETLSILSYVLAALKRNDGKSTEAGIKYALYGGITSGVMLFGMAHLYGILGTIHFSEVLESLSTLDQTKMLILLPSFVLVFVGLGYKIACVPFHMWSPDVYEGSPIPVTTFFAIVPKIAGIAVIVRITHIFFDKSGVLQDSWVGFLQVVAILTITLGNILAIGQKSVKRMLAYSSISHAGFMLIGVLVIDQIGISAICFYGVIYLFMTLGAFGITSFLGDQFNSDRFGIFDGLIKSHPFMSIAMIIIMFSLGGIPPFGGFIAKYNILSASLHKGFYTLAIIAALNSVISLYYYLRIVQSMVFKDATYEENIKGFTFINQLVMLGICFPILFLGFFWEKIMITATNAHLLVK